MRIGVFGGTFDPIHYGHLRAAEEVRESLGLARVVFVPSARPPHKALAAVSPPVHRLEMVRRAVEGHPAFEASDLECRRHGASYTVETLRVLSRPGGGAREIYFLLGSDAFREIETWRSYEELFSLCHWLVIQRPGHEPAGREAIPVAVRNGFRYDRRRRVYVHPSNRCLLFRRLSCLEISGSEIRRLVGLNRSVRYLVPDGVEAYIRERHLYLAHR
jgi:nicotinate-nucleotide adenylyltransferase